MMRIAESGGSADSGGDDAAPERTREMSLALKFYDGVVGDAGSLMAAAELEGLDGEVAVLRLRLRDLLKGGGDFEVVLKGVRLLTQVVAARYRMSPARTSEFADTLATAIQQVGSNFYPERFEDV
jgi:hypothetical protein